MDPSFTTAHGTAAGYSCTQLRCSTCYSDSTLAGARPCVTHAGEPPAWRSSRPSMCISTCMSAASHVSGRSNAAGFSPQLLPSSPRCVAEHEVGTRQKRWPVRLPPPSPSPLHKSAMEQRRTWPAAASVASAPPRPQRSAASRRARPPSRSVSTPRLSTSSATSAPHVAARCMLACPPSAAQPAASATSTPCSGEAGRFRVGVRAWRLPGCYGGAGCCGGRGRAQPARRSYCSFQRRSRTPHHARPAPTVVAAAAASAAAVRPATGAQLAQAADGRQEVRRGFA
eukprot:365351-Chlamydomonas_euryale.AAC.7